MTTRNATTEITKREFCDTFGVSEAQLERLFQQGMPHKKTSSRKIGIPMPEGRVWYHNYLIEKGKKQAAPKDIDDAKKRKLSAEAELAELELAQARDELMTVDQFERRFTDACARVDARLQNLPPRLAGAVLGATTIQEAQARIDPLVEEARDELRRGDDLEPMPEEDDAPEEEDETE